MRVEKREKVHKLSWLIFWVTVNLKVKIKKNIYPLRVEKGETRGQYSLLGNIKKSDYVTQARGIVQTGNLEIQWRKDNQWNTGIPGYKLHSNDRIGHPHREECYERENTNYRIT